MNHRHHLERDFPANLLGVDALGNANDADAVTLYDRLNERYRDRRLSSNTAEAVNEQRSNSSLGHCFRDTLKPVTVELRSRNGLIAEAQVLRNRETLSLRRFTTRAPLLIKTVFILQVRRVAKRRATSTGGAGVAVDVDPKSLPYRPESCPERTTDLEWYGRLAERVSQRSDCRCSQCGKPMEAQLDAGKKSFQPGQPIRFLGICAAHPSTHQAFEVPWSVIERLAIEAAEDA